MTWECSHGFGLFLLGGESPYWRKLLTENGARHVGINFKELLERMNAQRVWSVAEHFPGETEVLVDAGRSSAPDFDHDAHAEAYRAWVAANSERISLVVEYEGTGINREWRVMHRMALLDHIPTEKLLPVWHEADGPDELEHLCATFPRVAVVKPSAVMESRLKVIAGRFPVKLHGLGITGPDDLATLPLVTASSTSWIGPTKYCDTHVWAGGRFHWYPKRSSETARRRHAIDIDGAGFDSEAIAEGNRKEVSRYTIWVWQQYESYLSMRHSRGEGRIVAIRGSVGTTGNRGSEDGSVDHMSSSSESMELVRRTPDRIFPGLTFRQETIESTGDNPDEPARVVNVPSIIEANLRACSSCSVAKRCPAFDPQATCAYKMPVEIRTRPQLMGSLGALLEMQFQRVIFARAAEEMDGVVLNADTSSAINQYMKMVESLRAIESDPTFFKIEARGPQAQGILSQLLGQARGAQAREQAQAVDPDRAERAIRTVIDIGED